VTREITMLSALNEALREEMCRDEKVFVMGEDVSTAGVWGVTKGLAEMFGPERVRDTPISEAGFMGAGVGAAILGMRPIVEVRFVDFVFVGLDQLVNQAAKITYMSDAQIKLPIVFRAALGGGLSAGPHHSQSPEAVFVHFPGLNVVGPSTPYDAKGLFKTAVRDDNPVVFLEHKSLYNMRGPVPEEEYTIPFGVADVKREGKDVTVVATFMMVNKALEAAEDLARDGISVEVIDPRTLVPLDKQSILKSVHKTGRLIISTEECKTASFASEISAIVAEEALYDLDAPIKRVCSLDVPIPFSPPMENYVLPNVDKIKKAVKEVIHNSL